MGKNSTTSALKNHLKSKHIAIYVELFPEEVEKINQEKGFISFEKMLVIKKKVR
jgi:quinol monooxygenase YgiN